MKMKFHKTMWLLFIAVAITSCSKDEKQDEEGKGQCWYKITIDGTTVTPNQFGQDKFWLGSTTGPDGDTGFGIILSQTKANGQHYSAFTLNSDHSGPFNDKTSVGTTYPVDFFNAIELGLSDLGEYAYRMESHATPQEGVLTVSVLENSAQRIRFGVSGTIMKKEGGVENWTDIGLVPLEAEFSIDRTHYNEFTSGGVVGASATCDCTQQ